MEALNEMDEEERRRIRHLWQYDDYANAVRVVAMQRDELHRQALALADECSTRFAEAPHLPPLDNGG